MDAYAVLGVPPDASQAELKAAHRALVRRHHPDLAPPSEREAATRRLQQINVAYGLVRDPQRRAAYDQARGTARVDALVTAAGRWAGRWWRRNRVLLRRRAAGAAASAARTRGVGRRVATDAVGRVLWLLLCVVGAFGGWLVAVTAQRLVGVDGVVAPLVGAFGGLAAGSRRGWHLRLRLARVPLRLSGGAVDVVVVVGLIALGVWLDST